MFTIRDDGPLPGVGDLLADRSGSEPTAEDVQQFGRMIAASDLPISATMGVMDDVRGLFDRIFYRTFVREEPAFTCSMPWLECHVPPNGAAVIKSKATRVTDRSCELKIFGSGVGAGRKTTISIGTDSGPRSRCTAFAFDVEVVPKVFELRGREMIELHVVKLLGESVDTLEACPYCGVAPSSVDPFRFELGEHLDLRRDGAPLKRTVGLAVEGAFSASIGAKLPLPGGVSPQLSLSAKVSRGMSLDVEVTFPPGALYTGYRQLRAATPRTAMWAVERAAQKAEV
jgi:hypothetical protein